MIAFVLYDIFVNPTFQEHCLGPLYDWYASSTVHTERELRSTAM
jgi:hypothetical protein